MILPSRINLPRFFQREPHYKTWTDTGHAAVLSLLLALCLAYHRPAHALLFRKSCKPANRVPRALPFHTLWFLWKAFFSRFTFKQLNIDLGVWGFVFFCKLRIIILSPQHSVNSCGQRLCVTLKYTAVLMFIESIYWIPYRKPIIVFKMYFK